MIGAGVVGAAAALASARAGRRVALVEARSLAQAFGSSRGSARIFAPFPYPDEEHLEMGARALARWREVERESGERLLEPTGALSRGELAERALPVLQAAGVEAELLSADAALAHGVRMPDDRPLLYQRDAGTIRAELARAALLRLAVASGAQLHEGEAVTSIAEVGDGLEVESGNRRWLCDSAIVVAGPWSRALLARSGIELPVTATSQSVAYFDLPHPERRPAAVIEFDGDEPYSCWDPGHGLKAGLHVRGHVLDFERPEPSVDQNAIDRISSWAAERFPGVASRPAVVDACMYTSSDDERFILDAHGRIVIACACNGQGFQFAPETGECLARLAVGDGAVSGARS